jgi:AcrR family transcriptional regulator
MGWLTRGRSHCAGAGISKPMLYTYFGDKEALFDAALTQEVMDAAQADRFDPDDLEGYAGRTYDLLVERPRLWRLLTWHHLERGQDVLMLPAGEVLLGEKLDGIAAAQAEGGSSPTSRPWTSSGLSPPSPSSGA